ncbi:hypothetical protein [Ilyobacter polytropus]|uniref:Uncharacterized protein n=1 Tax=Ilyobacter polytropus (strain ATCC 51220 / DSM 2926 / LMG 16218 / CuHBu1) TaxID=572544 RepID=E3HDR5_ILYPC|nr:hypothetical protein [Ilyobacter polytropus]ADO84251.1 hypothetical protein Ilyop_2492 [Ilyobacter polytropus DSM 2926]
MMSKISSIRRKKMIYFIFSKSFHSIFKVFSTYNIDRNIVSILNLNKMNFTGIVAIR